MCEPGKRGFECGTYSFGFAFGAGFKVTAMKAVVGFANDADRQLADGSAFIGTNL